MLSFLVRQTGRLPDTILYIIRVAGGLVSPVCMVGDKPPPCANDIVVLLDFFEFSINHIVIIIRLRFVVSVSISGLMNTVTITRLSLLIHLC